MAYNKKYAELGESVIDYVNEREDAIEASFNDVDTDINGVSQELNNFKAEVSDYVVEQGANYTKWNSGKAEAWGRGTITPSSDDSSSVGGQTWYRNSRTETLPINFVAVDTVSATPVTTIPWGVNTSAMFDVTTGNTMTIWLVRYNTTTTEVSWYLLGRWK